MGSVAVPLGIAVVSTLAGKRVSDIETDKAERKAKKQQRKLLADAAALRQNSSVKSIELKASAARDRARLAAMGGMSASDTILSGPSGVTGGPTGGAIKTLLGQ